jgi:putative SOS response-associated peptidase YedK
MCFSAKVQQDVHKLARDFHAKVADDEFLDLFERRTAGETIKVSRALELAFHEPVNATERQIKRVIDAYSASQTREWETEIFKQRRRRTVAEESLKKRETKAAQESVRIATRKIETLLTRLSDLKKSDSRDSDGRIFPMVYAPVIMEIDGHRQVWPMRYTCRLAGKPAEYDAKYPGTYNARRDSLNGFWRPVYGRNHAVIVISRFYENVPKHLYEHRSLAEGENASNLVLQFTPDTGRDLLVACLWDRWQGKDGTELYSFTAITDDPPPEVAATGHQRCVIALQESNVEEWLAPANVARDRLESILSDKEIPYYQNSIAA